MNKIKKNEWNAKIMNEMKKMNEWNEEKISEMMK